MTADEFIQDAIDRGSRDGASPLGPLARAVFLISEAEVECDMGGIDGFVERRDAGMLRETAAAFALVGAGEIRKGTRCRRDFAAGLGRWPAGASR